MDNISNSDIVRIDYDNILEELLNQPVKYQESSEKYAKISRQLELKTQELKFLTAKKALAFRSAAKANGNKITEGLLLNMLEADKELMALTIEKIELQQEKDVRFGIMRALEHKKECLKTLGYSYSKDI